jgi:protein-disulfide isomerase
MRIGWRWTWSAGVAGAVLVLGLNVWAQTAPPKGAAATVGNEVITTADLEKSIATELARLDEQRYRTLERRLEQMIGERLLANEAKRRGVSLDALVQAEITAKTPAVTAEDVNTFIAQNRARLPEGNTMELRMKVADYLQRMQAGQRTDAFVASLRTQTPVQVFLTPPEPVRVVVDPKIGFARGPETAPVTIVEFTDFQCPFCKSVVPTLQQVVTQYADRVRWVFRDFPIAGLHPEAEVVHEAARCAGDQGKFWSFHDLAFEQGAQATQAALRDYAKRAGADVPVFDKCVESRKHRAAVAADIEEGKKLGVTGTPTFFINGALFVGNQPFAEFQRVIERELSRTASTKPAR